MSEVSLEDVVGPVPRAIYPLVMNVVCRRGSHHAVVGDVLAYRPVAARQRCVTVALKAVVEGLTIARVVGKVVATDHLLRMGAGGVLECGMYAEACKPVAGAGSVAQV